MDLEWQLVRAWGSPAPAYKYGTIDGVPIQSHYWSPHCRTDWKTSTVQLKASLNIQRGALSIVSELSMANVCAQNARIGIAGKAYVKKHLFKLYPKPVNVGLFVCHLGDC